jgi:hypothetical protein
MIEDDDMDASLDGGISKRAVCEALGLQDSGVGGTDDLSATPVGLGRFVVIEAFHARIAEPAN